MRLEIPVVMHISAVEMRACEKAGDLSDDFIVMYLLYVHSFTAEDEGRVG